MRCVALRHWKSLAAKYTRKLNAVERVFDTKYKQENISDVTSGIFQKRHLVTTEDLSIINQALKIYLQKMFQEALPWVSRDYTVLNTVTRPTSKFFKVEYVKLFVLGKSLKQMFFCSFVLLIEIQKLLSHNCSEHD